MANALMTFVQMAIGGVATEWADRTYPDKGKELGGVAIGPGTMGAGAALLGLGLFGRKIPEGPRRFLGNIAGGGAVVGLTKVGGQLVGDYLPKPAATSGAAAAAAQGAIPPSAQAQAMGYGRRGYGPTQWELQQGLAAFRAY